MVTLRLRLFMTYPRSHDFQEYWALEVIFNWAHLEMCLCPDGADSVWLKSAAPLAGQIGSACQGNVFRIRVVRGGRTAVCVAPRFRANAVAALGRSSETSRIPGNESMLVSQVLWNRNIWSVFEWKHSWHTSQLQAHSTATWRPCLFQSPHLVRVITVCHCAKLLQYYGLCSLCHTCHPCYLFNDQMFVSLVIKETASPF